MKPVKEPQRLNDSVVFFDKTTLLLNHIKDVAKEKVFTHITEHLHKNVRTGSNMMKETSQT